MADESGKDPGRNETPAAGKSGAVKPPVLEGTARPVAGEKPADRPAKPAVAAKPEKPEPPKPTPRPAVSSADDDSAGAPWLAGLLGGVIGLGAAYGLAWMDLWPATESAAPQADPRIAQLATAVPELETVNADLAEQLGTLTERLAALEAAPDAPAADPAIAENLSTLAERIEALESAPAPSPTDDGSAAANAEAIAALEQQLAALRTDVDGAATEAATANKAIAALNEAGNTADPAAIARLPLIFSGLETAFAAGRPFETELAALRQAQPETIVPEAVAGRATTGLPRPDDVERQLAAVLPDMLAGIPAEADASWQDNAAGWFRGIIAMRPAGAAEGDGPDAVVSRLEAAVARGDFAAAQAEFDALPEAMQDAAGGLGNDIAALAAAQDFLTNLRTTVLAGESGA
jgi:hypothetical protein